MPSSKSHPYRDLDELRALIPPDRRAMKARIVASACFLAGAICLAATEAALDAASGCGEVFVRPDGDVLLVNGRWATTPEPAPYTGAPPTVVDMPTVGYQPISVPAAAPRSTE